MAENTDSTIEGFEEILHHLKETRGFDFTGYKRSSLMRRVDRRMTQVSVDSYVDYLDVLQANADEFVALFNTILINVTGFFRDPEAWDYLHTDVVPSLLAEYGPDEPLRLWSAGCATGEEAYSLAIVMAEALGPDDCVGPSSNSRRRTPTAPATSSTLWPYRLASRS